MPLTSGQRSKVSETVVPQVGQKWTKTFWRLLSDTCS
jgi:hypothetical protein